MQKTLATDHNNNKIHVIVGHEETDINELVLENMRLLADLMESVIDEVRSLGAEIAADREQSRDH